MYTVTHFCTTARYLTNHVQNGCLLRLFNWRKLFVLLHNRLKIYDTKESSSEMSDVVLQIIKVNVR